MKKVILIIIFTTLFVSISAQSRRFSWGARAGVNMTSLMSPKDEKTEEIKGKVGLTGGLFAEIAASSNIFVTTELLYSEQGAVIDINGRMRKLTTRQLNIPIFVGFGTPMDQSANLLMLNFGIQFEKSLGGKIENESGMSLSRAGYDPCDFGISLPIVLSYSPTPGLLFDARYNIGLTRVFADSDFRNSVFSLTVGWKFQYEKKETHNCRKDILLTNSNRLYKSI